METLFIGKNSIFLPETESTNSYATNLLKNVNPAEGTVIHTAHQTGGKGQRGSRWDTDPLRNLTASIILKPSFLELKNQFYLYQIAALACHDTLAEILGSGHYDIKIKWPNDLLVDRKKIAGILIENKLTSNIINWSVAGIGINVNQLNFGEVTSATSLRLLTGLETAISQVLAVFCSHLEKYYLQLKAGKSQSIFQAYLDNMFGIDQLIDFLTAEGPKKFVVKGVSQSGLLVLQDELGKTMEADVKQLAWLY